MHMAASYFCHTKQFNGRFAPMEHTLFSLNLLEGMIGLSINLFSNPFTARIAVLNVISQMVECLYPQIRRVAGAPRDDRPLCFVCGVLWGRG